ncbi:MAG: hypothetical protein NTY68_00650 [Candidatus Micrarchaeota archaeon]|nr:hypothetical protein [Candidatus Micrarchaeota archaeon]
MAESLNVIRGKRGPNKISGYRTMRKAKDAIEGKKGISPAKYIMCETDLHEFNSNILQVDTMEKGMVQASYIEYSNIQSLRDCCEGGRSIEDLRSALSSWCAYASTQGTALYSLRRNVPAGVIGKFDIEFRPADPNEARNDFESYGEQVILKTWKEATEKERKTGTMVCALGEEFLYTGPPRMRKFIFTTRAFQGDLPEDLTQAIYEIDNQPFPYPAEVNFANFVRSDMVQHQGYHFFHANKGRIMYSAFLKPEDYDPKKMSMFGDIEIEDKRLIFYPNGDRGMPKDFGELPIE